MKCKVKLTRTVELIVEGKSEDSILDWLCTATPEEAYLVADGGADEEYSEEIICPVRDDSEVDYVIKEKNSMKTWKIPVVWQEMGTVAVEANTLAEAIEIARDDDGVIPIPYNGIFVDGSWEVDCDDEEFVRVYYNFGQKDEED